MSARRDTTWHLMMVIALFAALLGLLVDPFFGPRIQALPKTIKIIATEAVEAPKRAETDRWNRANDERRYQQWLEAKHRGL